MTSAAAAGKTKYEMPSDNQLVATRVFDASRELMFDVHTVPEHVRKWLLGPDGWTMSVCEIDLKPEGKWRYVWTNDTSGDEFFMNGEYKEIARPSLVSSTERFMGQEPGALNLLEFTEKNGRTTMKLTITYPSKEVREQVMATGMTGGMDTSYDRLDGILASLR